VDLNGHNKYANEGLKVTHLKNFYSHFLLLFNLFLFLLIVLHYLQPLSLYQSSLFDIKLFFCLQATMHMT